MGGGIVHPVDRGGGVPSLSVCLERVGSMAYTAAHTKNKKALWHRWGRQVWRPTVQGYTIPVAKIVQMSAEYAKLA